MNFLKILKIYNNLCFFFFYFFKIYFFISFLITEMEILLNQL
jgi:hypothetical protein